MHRDAVVHIAKYLKHTKHIGLTLWPTKVLGLEVFSAVDFDGNWNKMEVEFDPDTA